MGEALLLIWILMISLYVFNSPFRSDSAELEHVTVDKCMGEFDYTGTN